MCEVWIYLPAENFEKDDVVPPFTFGGTWILARCQELKLASNHEHYYYYRHVRISYILRLPYDHCRREPVRNPTYQCGRGHMHMVSDVNTSAQAFMCDIAPASALQQLNYNFHKCALGN